MCKSYFLSCNTHVANLWNRKLRYTFFQYVYKICFSSDLMISLNWIDNDGLLSPDNHDINREPDGKGEDEEVLQEDNQDGKPVDGSVTASGSKVFGKKVQPIFRRKSYISLICN